MERPKIKIDDIIEGIEMSHDQCQTYLDLHTGCLEYIDDQTQWAMRDDPADLPEWQRPLVEIAQQIEADEDGERFVPLPDQFDAHEWQMMADFAQDVEDDSVRHQLTDACRGRGASRCFKNTVHRLGLEKRWFAYRDEQYRQCAIDWCQANGIPWR